MQPLAVQFCSPSCNNKGLGKAYVIDAIHLAPYKNPSFQYYQAGNENELKNVIKINSKMKALKLALSLIFLGCTLVVAQSFKEGTRQIHLDFHTSELIEDIGSEFSKAQFQEALKTAKVNSINIFSKGHHGWSYYDTKLGKKHPHLNFDLLKEQIEACHEIGVRAQAYYTIGWSAKDAREHPEWIIKDKQGNEIWFGSGLDDDIRRDEKLYPFYSWATLSPEGAYLDLILAEVEELAKNYDLDGFWFDIVPFQYPNYSELGRKDLVANGIDLDDDKAVERHHIKKMKIFLDKTREIVKKYKPDASIFYNWTTHCNIPQSLDCQLEQYNTKLDLEDLPTTWDGYDLFPLNAKYYGNLDMDYVAMSGKFHTAWGEFGGFKHKDAIWYEAASVTVPETTSCTLSSAFRGSTFGAIFLAFRGF